MFEFDPSIIYPHDPSATDERIDEYKSYYRIKYDICKEECPLVIAEIGVRAGYSAWSFLMAAPTAKYYGFDANNGTHGGQGGEDNSFHEWAKKILKESNYDFELIQIDTQLVDDLPVSNVDLFHVDGDHSEKGVKHDLDLALKCMNKGGLILIDDITYIDTVGKGVSSWLQEHPDLSYEYRKSLRGECLIRV